MSVRIGATGLWEWDPCDTSPPTLTSNFYTPNWLSFSLGNVSLPRARWILRGEEKRDGSEWNVGGALTGGRGMEEEKDRNRYSPHLMFPPTFRPRLRGRYHAVSRRTTHACAGHAVRTEFVHLPLWRSVYVQRYSLTDRLTPRILIVCTRWSSGILSGIENFVFLSLVFAHVPLSTGSIIWFRSKHLAFFLHNAPMVCVHLVA